MRVRPIEDILESKNPPTFNTYHALKRALMYYTKPTDAAHLAYHLNIPQKVLKDPVETKHSILPQADQLSCLHCDHTLNIPMKYPRFRQTTYKAQRIVIYKRSEPQTCLCGNLNTMTDLHGNLKVYIRDKDESSFLLHSGPINLLIVAQYAPKKHNIDLVLNKYRPINTNFMSYERRKDLSVNHINLYRASEDVIRTLLPIEDPKGYARTYNITLLLNKTLYFPTGHKVLVKEFPIWTLLVSDVIDDSQVPQSTTITKLFKNPQLTLKSAATKNAVISHIYHNMLPVYLNKQHEELSARIALTLDIPRTYAPRPPQSSFILHTRVPLSLHRELLILRLPFAIDSELTPKYSLQDFYQKAILVNHKNTRQYAVYETTLQLFKRERLRSIYKMLPRYLKFATVPIDHIKYSIVPPHTQPSIFSHPQLPFFSQVPVRFR